MTNSENILSNITLGLSLSESPDIKRLGFSDVHFRDIFIEFSRYMLACGATLAYGGDFRKGGFTEELMDLKATYKGNANKIVNYLGWPIHAEMDSKLSQKELLKYKKVADFKKSEIPDGVDNKILRNKFLPPIKTKLDNMLIWARSMSKMRHELLAKNNDAQIMLGGRMVNYSSKYPGLVEEAYEIMKAGKPLYLIGAFGGATKAIIDAVSGERPEALTEEGQYKLWAQWEEDTRKLNAAKAEADLQQAPVEIEQAIEEIKQAEAEMSAAKGHEERYNAKQNKKQAEKNKADAEKKLAKAKSFNPQARLQNYKGLVEHFNQHAPPSEERINYSQLTDFFNEKGIAGLNNHLSEDDNRRLFQTPHVAEMIALVLKGLAEIKSSRVIS